LRAGHDVLFRKYQRSRASHEELIVVEAWIKQIERQ
jgi:hypothetical protein